MCKAIQIVSIQCDCRRCDNAALLDKEHSGGYYPHYGTKIVSDDGNPNYSYIEVKAENKCSNAFVNEEGHWRSCSNSPEISDKIVIWSGTKDSPPGRRVCGECKDICLAPSKLRPT
ncbi:hypothetical protein FHL15_010666 [Xylaria flabelliformis]|uniref:Uncharacterized protein n=1 Tax=Xylaria flabelliformis TaxID=2512241 RepID=A0A553HKK4_9PEZI|nr:hypothetical protein FHL15_010666 [Xylaria flabelliformis]